MEDIRQTKEWAGYLRSSGWIVKKMGRVYVFIKRIPLSPFSMMKIQRFEGDLDIENMEKLKRRHKVIYSVVEPSVLSGYDPLSARWPKGPAPPLSGGAPVRVGPFGWRVNKSPFLPTKTVLVDLRRSEKELWNDLSTNAKRILKKKTGAMVVELEDKNGRDRFYKAWKESSKTWIMSEDRFDKLLDAFPKKASLWVSEDNSEIVSGVLLLNSKDAVNYFQTFTSKRGRDTGTHYKLVWEVMLKSKREGFRYFDFEGVLDKRWPMKKWAGFSEFKNKFGGEMVSYPGSFVRWF